MAAGQGANLRGRSAPLAEPSYCPECGQPLNLARPRAEPGRGGVGWRAIFVVVMGLYLAAAFGLDAWHANWTLRAANSCPPVERSDGCVALPRDLTLAIASGRVTTGDTFAARAAEIQFGRDVRFAAVGLAGLVVGLGALLLGPRRARSGRLAGAVWATAGVLALVYAEIAAISVYHLVALSPADAPLSWDALADAADRALGGIAGLVGG